MTRRRPYDRNPSRYRWLSITIGILIAAPVIAQPIEGEAVYELAPFTVEAFNLPFAVEDYPGSMEILTEEDLHSTGQQTLAETLEAAANISLSSFSGNSASATVDLRGYGENSSLRTLILVDGQPLNRADMGTPSWLEIPLFQIDRVEILRGPQTARFGDFAVGGVINIITRLDPSAAPRTQLDGGAGSYDEHWGRIHHSRPIGGGAMSLFAEHTETDGYRDNGGYRASSAGISFAKAFDQGPALRIRAFYLDDRVEFPGSLPSGSDGGFPDNPREFTGGNPSLHFSDNQKGSLSFAAAWPEISPNGRLELRGGGHWRELKWNLGAGAHGNDEQTGGQVSLEYQQEQDSGITWGTGLAANATVLDFEAFRDFERTRILSYANLDKVSAAGYGYLDWEFSEEWSLSAAARAELHDVNGENTDLSDPDAGFNEAVTHRGWSSQLGLQWNPAVGWRTWIRYDRLYRFPVADEIAAYRRIRLAVPFNKDLGPEEGNNLEIGAEWSGSNGSISTNFFTQQLEGEIGFDFANSLNVNLADTERFGAEISAKTNLHDWKLRVAYTWLEARFRNGEIRDEYETIHIELKGNHIPLVSPHTLSASLTSPRWLKTQMQVEAIYRHRAYEGNDFANTEPPLPGWTTVNFSLNSELSNSLSAYFRINNIFNRQYATLKFLNSWYPAPERQIRAGLQWEF